VGNRKKWKLPEGIFLRNDVIWVRFTFKRTQCSESTGSKCLRQSDIAHAQGLLGEIKRKISDKTFRYADYFPESNKLLKFGYAKSGATCKNYMDQQLTHSQGKGLSKSTLDGYRKCINQLSWFHDIAIADLSPSHCKAYIMQNKNLTAKTLRNRFSFFRQAIGEAVIDGLITDNPVARIKVNDYHSDRQKINRDGENEDVDPFTPAEVRALIEKSKANPVYHVFTCIGFGKGLRMSELTGLGWDSISFVSKRLRIREARVLGSQKTTKTKASKRDLELTANDIALLTELKPYTFLVSDFVFINAYKNPVDQDAFRDVYWKPLCKRAGVRYRPPSQMRHTFATKLISEGKNLWAVAELMGHTSPKMLYEHYGSFIEAYELEKLQAEEAEHIEQKEWRAEKELRLQSVK
jgi:integrase